MNERYLIISKFDFDHQRLGSFSESFKTEKAAQAVYNERFGAGYYLIRATVIGPPLQPVLGKWRSNHCHSTCKWHTECNPGCLKLNKGELNDYPPFDYQGSEEC